MSNILYKHNDFEINKYHNLYFRIVKNAQSKDNSKNYHETHHIIPKSLEGKDDILNLVILTAREHFLCHYLLCKFVKNQSKYKMLHAFNLMSNVKSKEQKRYVNSRLYESLKSQISEAASIRQKEFSNSLSSSERKKLFGSSGKKNGMFGTSRTGKNNPFFGKKHSSKTKNKLSELAKIRPNYTIDTIWVNNGKNNKRVKGNIPDGYSKGQLPQPHITCPHCLKSGDAGNMKQWHFNKCKFKKSQ